MSQMNLYIDCTNGISGDMLCRCLADLSGNLGFVEAQQKIIQERLDGESNQAHHHAHADEHAHDHGHEHSHPTPYIHRSFQSILTLLKESGLEDKVKTTSIRIYTVLATAEAQVHGETLETVHFHEVGRPQAIINMVGVAAAFTAIDPAKVYCSKIIDGIGTVHCAHGEIPVPVPAVRALMKTSGLPFGTKELEMEMVTPTGLAALMAMDPAYMELETIHSAANPNNEVLVKSTETRGTKKAENARLINGLKAFLMKDLS